MLVWGTSDTDSDRRGSRALEDSTEEVVMGLENRKER